MTRGLAERRVDTPAMYGALASLSRDVGDKLESYGSLGKVPAAATPNLRGDMYLVLDAGKLIVADEGARTHFTAAEIDGIKAYGSRLEQGTRYIPLWVKITVAIALGLGTMVGWRRIVVTVGERIGKTHLTYGMGMSAELVTAATILLADHFASPCRRRTSCRRASPARRSRMVRACNGAPCATWRSPGS